MSSPAALHGQEVRQRLLTAAVELIPERGWTAVSTRTLAERAGVTPSVVHYHFRSLQALLREAVIGAMEREVAELESLLDAVHTADELVEAIFAEVNRPSTGQDTMSLVFVEAYLVATRDEPLRDAIAGLLQASRLRFARRMAEWDVAAADDSALILLAALDGLLLYRGLGVASGGATEVLKRLFAGQAKPIDEPR
ncbi:hypothetical protein Mycch_4142 [Mycolicibacterium chubuense NBB4]|uniref:HTH tetR-type domain-containing protein n=1 Tax=Mycolicibacterium chubuense (strain NBB4) TaxID=710421 RepID=I4BNK6_MYCCN|nr:hypothetical protein Mycch_4142 [Mycolicibacterium chubuense NBB4]